MKGTLIDFLKVVSEKPELAKELSKLAAKYGFEFYGELSDDDLEPVSGGGIYESSTQGAASGDLGGTGSPSTSEIWAASQEKDEQMAASTQEHINRLGAMIIEMQKLAQQSSDSSLNIS